MLDQLHADHFKVVVHVVIEAAGLQAPSRIHAQLTRFRADARPTTAGRRIVRFRVTGRSTKPSWTWASMGSGPIRATALMDRRD
jgi:hypothetical protein